MAGGSQKKTCSNCRQKIYCGVKTCNFCKHPQPKHVRLQKKLDKFRSQEKQWLSSMKKNNIKSHILDDAAILVCTIVYSSPFTKGAKILFITLT